VKLNLAAIQNVLKAWLLLVVACGALALAGWELGGYRLLSIFLFCGLLLAAAVYWYSDRVALGMVGARELPFGEAPALHSTVERLAAIAGVAKPKLYLMTDGLPRALAVGRGPRGSTLAVSAGLVAACPPAELEAVLVGHPAVADVAVIPSADDAAGEVPKALVVAREPVDDDALLAFVAERVAPYKKVRRLEFVDEIPKAPSGKILRRVLVERERARAGAATP
jgi:hypothetical protein